ncbi:MAG: 3-keto-5-aminohexanoate cleavage protein [Acidaminococcales bacterium]|jgi:uncharacterized protein (DUF849 family)|nr:3-keto-5-aminohexanoate cleavage protein [Acidaminococcales bacterium]
MRKVIIAAALLGAGTTRAQSPHVPLTPDEIAADVVAVAKAGAAIAHIHVRDKNGANTMETSAFAEVMEKSQAACRKADIDIVFNLTSSGGKFPYVMRQAHLKLLRPEMCSLTPNSMNWANSYLFKNEPEFIKELANTILENDIKPEIEIFDASMLESAKYYIAKGLFKTPCHFQFVIGVAVPGNIMHLSFMLQQMPEGSTWSVTGIGKAHLPMLLAGLAESCTCLRVGLEDNVFLAKGVYATNVSLVERAVSMAKLAGCGIATPDEAREILGIGRNWRQ